VQHSFIVCVGPEVNGQPLETQYNFDEHVQETVCISTHPFHNTMEAVERIDPGKKIKPLLVLAFGVNVSLRPLLSPDSAQLRMKRKAGFILKKHHPVTVAFSGLEEFFLTHLEIQQPPRPWPERIGKAGGAENSPVSLSYSGRAAPEPLHNCS
jgi:hypothetical protein